MTALGVQKKRIADLRSEAAVQDLAGVDAFLVRVGHAGVDTGAAVADRPDVALRVETRTVVNYLAQKSKDGRNNKDGRTRRWTSRPTNEQSYKKPTNQPTNKQTSKPEGRQTGSQATQPSNQPSIQRANQTTKQPASQP